MTRAQAAVAAEITQMVRQELGWTGDPPPADAPLAERLDSLHLLALVVAVEDRYHVVLTDDDAAAARSLADLSRLVVERAPVERLPEEASP